MPIGEFEREILRRIARNRNPDSFAGATVLHQSATSPRASRDVDVFHDTTESLALSVEADFVDIHYLHFHHLHFGALVWAASGKDGGLTPQMILEWTRRQAFYTPEQVKEVQVSTPLDLVQMRRDWMGMVAEAEALLDKLPPAERGCLYLNSEGKPVYLDPGSPEFPKLVRHYGSVKGAWPRIVE